MAATIYDVAARAGVSIKSVSRVINDEPNVSPALKARINAAIQSLGYRRNLSARGLAGRSAPLIAAFVDERLTLDHWRSGRGNDYLSRLELGALMECRRADHHLVVELINHDSGHLTRDIWAFIGAIRPAGVLMTPPNSDNQVALDALDALNVPYARIGPERDIGRGVCVSMDERAAAEEMTRHLIALGHRRIGFIGGPGIYFAARERAAGYRSALAAAHPALEPLMEQGDFTFDSGVEAARRLLSGDPPTAIFAANDDMALGVLHAAAAMKISTPQALSVAGFDDSPSALFMSPSLTTIRQPVAEMAAAAVRGLLTKGPADTGTVDLRIPYALLVRESSTTPTA